AAARIGVQLLSALEHAHEKGYVHRDIKPSNLLVMGPPNRPKLKLSDFGLAKSFRDNAGFAGLTHQGDVGGSVGFLSPDHIRDFREVKEPADIYSTGATLYYLLTGTFPFLDFDPNRGDAYTMILEHPSVPLRAHRPDAPEGFDAILRKALEKQARERWKSASAMAKALMPYIEGPL
ncbi:MAG TPA: serine/threonine-protein kinase, partial [Isosphaeraceae bacterium]|nr:serine/threonine-protein kinase [Isosphaeraceae bacterium]